MKKIIFSFVLLIILSSIVAGCSGKNAGKNGEVTLTVFSTMTNDSEKNALRSIADDFEKENEGIKIDISFPGPDYENMLRVKMAANDMPDLFDTHGWAKIRYKEYTADLKDMDWVKHLDPNLDPILKDEKGKVYAYPFNQAKDGIVYNAGLLKKYGLKPPQTLDELMHALETIKEKSKGNVIPFWFAGSDKGALAQFYDQFATPLLITDDRRNEKKALENGAFDWSGYTLLAETFKEMQEKQLVNKDILTAKPSQLVELMAQGKIGFTLSVTSIGPDTREVNPDIQLGVMPTPAVYEGDKPSWIGGERHTVAVWKDSEYLEEAKRFIEFAAQPKYVKKIAEATSFPQALTNTEAENYYSKFYDQYKQIEIEPYFDRIYLPSGMWDVMGTTGQELLAGTLTPKQVSEKMKQEYSRLQDQ
ncbi:ABC transporter substrate-binding protein [Bacillus haynesii]|uniref:ABC transporter substrate-binding protein n=1 Tax=Bacillus haynesii TaxID=1925021 RepID=UPI002281B686|nr:extracellular solute-binding protein [Bacillus haynesii]MCY8143507.1 extracellular solute-binding protein [Bacillus haynesii]MCY8379913.1 extracellular solute-binding protein [Bacillus haynesii]MCY8641603.1 extracellular solute-binding protein [Bacillus haynesii]MCY8665766.1 extracellular solute-binding protein [Bacillus haynesii]MEC0673202.1 extracellular solute-binding protein [Bacillus haynesii]